MDATKATVTRIQHVIGLRGSILPGKSFDKQLSLSRFYVSDFSEFAIKDPMVTVRLVSPPASLDKNRQA